MKKIIYFITLLFLVGCVDLSENMYNDLGKDNYYQTEQEYDAAFMNQYAFLRTMYAWECILSARDYYRRSLFTPKRARRL